jgi:hypothetical protein
MTSRLALLRIVVSNQVRLFSQHLESGEKTGEGEVWGSCRQGNEEIRLYMVNEGEKQEFWEGNLSMHSNKSSFTLTHESST